MYDDAGRLVEIWYFNPGDHVNPVKTVIFELGSALDIGHFVKY